MKTDHLRLKAALLVCLLLTLAASEAHAQHDKGFYASLELGTNFAPGIRFARGHHQRQGEHLRRAPEPVYRSHASILRRPGCSRHSLDQRFRPRQRVHGWRSNGIPLS